MKSALAEWLSGRAISIGRSVIPDADHSRCERFDWLGVRDDASLRSLHAAGLNHAFYFPDLSFLAPPIVEPGVARTAVGMSFRRSIPELQFSNNYEALLRSHLARYLGSGCARLPHIYAFHQVDEDAELADALGAKYGLARCVQRLTLATYESFYKTCSIVVSNRLHCLLLGAYCGAIPIAMTTSTHTKLASLFETVGWRSLLVCMDREERLAEAIARIQDNPSQYRIIVSSTFEQQRSLGTSILNQRLSGATPNVITPTSWCAE